MNTIKHRLIALSSFACVACTLAGCSSQQHVTGHLAVTRATSRPSTTGTSDHFTGKAVITMLYTPNQDRHASSATVEFEPGARTVWHMHPAGQTLVLTQGRGWVQSWDGERQDIAEGDVVWIPPNVKHWHGATATDRMVHVATQEQIHDEAVTWMEPVTDEQYGTAAAGAGTAVPPSSADSIGGTREEKEQMQIQLSVDGGGLTATLADNAAAHDFVALLPLKLTLKDYANTEKVSDLPRRLTTEGAPAGIDPEVGDITYYAPWGNLAIFYRDFGYANGLVKLGHIETGIETLAGQRNDFAVRVERADR